MQTSQNAQEWVIDDVPRMHGGQVTHEARGSAPEFGLTNGASYDAAWKADNWRSLWRRCFSELLAQRPRACRLSS